MASAQQLAAYEHQLEEFRPDDREAFMRLVREGMDLLDLRAIDLCEQFDVSRPSVQRWREGRSAPHPAVRQRVVNHLAERTRVQLARVPSPALHVGAGA